MNSCQIVNTTILRLSPVYSDNNLSNVEKRVIPVKKSYMKLKVFPSPLHSFCHIDSLKNTISNILDNTGKSTMNVVDNTPYSQKEIYQWFKGFPIPIHVFMVLPIYWITFLLPKSIGYKMRRTWSKLFASNIYEN